MGEVLNWFLKKECLNISERILAVYKIQRHISYTVTKLCDLCAYCV